PAATKKATLAGGSQRQAILPTGKKTAKRFQSAAWPSCFLTACPSLKRERRRLVPSLTLQARIGLYEFQSAWLANRIRLPVTSRIITLRAIIAATSTKAAAQARRCHSS